MRALLALLLVLLPLAGHAQSGAALPSGYLNVVGNQIQDGSGNNVRIASTSYRGLPTDLATMQAIRTAGFNTIRLDWRDAFLNGGATTWNPADISSGMTLSNGNKTATSSGAQSVRSTTSKASGKACWDTTASTISFDYGAGFSNANYVLGSSLGLDANGMAIYAAQTGTSQIVFYQNVFQSQGTATSVNGEVITQCADFSAKLYWATDSAMRTSSGAGAWNNSGTCNPTVATCGVSFSATTGPFFATYHNIEGGTAVLNTAGPLTVALPSGFSFWDVATPTGCNTMTDFDQCIANAKTAGLKVVFSHRGNEAPVGACVTTQQNGLWFDSGGSSGGADGCGTTGNVSYATFKADTVALMQRYANNSTVIGYEFHANPLVSGTFTGQTPAGGGGTGQFTASAGKILDPAGGAWFARGLNMFDSQLIDQVSPAVFQARFPRANMIRLAIGDDNCTGTSITNCNRPIANIESAGDGMTAKGIVVMVDPHLGAAGTDVNSVNKYNEAKFLGQIAADKKGDPYWWFESINEPCCAGGTGLTAEHQNVYYAVRNAGAPWAATTAMPYHSLRNRNGNLYMESGGTPTAATWPTICTTGSTGPSGTGTGIGDGSCTWDFVSTYSQPSTGGSNAFILFMLWQGGSVGGTFVGGYAPDGPKSAYTVMTGVGWDQHWYSIATNYSSSQTTANSEYVIAANSDAAWTNSADGAMPVIAAENGYICYNGSCDQTNTINGLSASNPSVNSAFNDSAHSGTTIWLWHWDGGQPSTDQTTQDGSARTVNGDNSNLSTNIAAGPVPARVSGGTPVPNPAVNWNGGGDTDIRAACSDVGTAVFAVNPGVIQFCSAPLNNGTLLLNGSAKP